MEQPYLGSIFIFMAAIFDLLDGWTARALKVFSPHGKDLDSLSDLVSFGVAPAMILFKMLWITIMMQTDAMDAGIWMLCPAFAIAIFAAIRLARFNNMPEETPGHFVGMPTPAIGLYIATFPLMEWYQPGRSYSLLHSNSTLYLLIAVLCYLMVSRIYFFKAVPKSWKLKDCWRQILLPVVTAACIPFFGWATADIAFLLYIALSILYKPKVLIETTA